MKQFSILTGIIAGAVVVGLLVFKSSSSNPHQSAASAEQSDGMHPPPSALAAIRAPRTQRDGARAIGSENISWREPLSKLQADETELFGVSGDDRIKALQDFAESILAAELPAVLRELQTMQEQKPTLAGRDLEMRLLKRLAENDPSAAATWAGSLTGDARKDGLVAAASIWARKDFSDAAAWAQQLPGADDREDATKSVVSEALYSNPAEALKIVAQLPVDSERNDLIARAAAAWATSAPADAAEWVKQLPDDAARKQASAAIAIAWADKDPIAAGNLAINSLPPGKDQEEAVFAVLRRWSLQDKEAAEAWVARFPDEELRVRATEMLASDTARLSAVVPAEPAKSRFRGME